MQDGLQDVNALVEQAAAKNKTAADELAAKEKEAAAGQETPEQIAAREKEAAEKLKQEQETPEQKSEREKTEKAAQETAEKEKTEADKKRTEDLLKENEELKKALAEKNDKAGKSPEQIKKDEEVYQAKLKAYAVENDLMKSDDLHRYDTVKSSADEDLVFNAFAAEMKEEILESLDDNATEDEIIAAIRKEFESEYPINSKSDKVKARAEAKLLKAANEIRSPLESSFNTAKTRFDDEESVRNEYPKYQEAIKKITTGIIPDNFSFFKEVDGEDEIDIQVPVSEEDKKAILESIEKIIKDPENFLLHKNGKTEEVQNKIKSEVEYQLSKRLSDAGKKEMAKKLLELGNSRGLAKGSDTGAKNSFAVNQDGGKKETSKSGVTAQQDVIESTRVKK